VVLDHGQHFFTIYMHLSKIQVREEARKTQKAAPGIEWRYGPCDRAAPSYGRPLEGSYVDPTKLFALTLPETNKVVRTAATLSVKR
jgi:hypothetical protein